MESPPQSLQFISPPRSSRPPDLERALSQLPSPSKKDRDAIAAAAQAMDYQLQSPTAVIRNNGGLEFFISSQSEGDFALRIVGLVSKEKMLSSLLALKSDLAARLRDAGVTIHQEGQGLKSVFLDVQAQIAVLIREQKTDFQKLMAKWPMLRDESVKSRGRFEAAVHLLADEKCPSKVREVLARYFNWTTYMERILKDLTALLAYAVSDEAAKGSAPASPSSSRLFIVGVSNGYTPEKARTSERMAYISQRSGREQACEPFELPESLRCASKEELLVSISMQLWDLIGREGALLNAFVEIARERTELRAAIGRLQEEHGTIMGLVETLRRDCEGLATQARRMREERDTATAERSALAAANDDLRKANEALEGRGEALEQRAEALESRSAALEAKLADGQRAARSEASSAAAEADAAELARRQAEEDRADALQRLERVRTESEQRALEIHRLREEREAIARKAESALAARRSLADQLAAAQRQAEQLASQAEGLAEAQRRADEAAAAAEELAASQRRAEQRARKADVLEASLRRAEEERRALEAQLQSEAAERAALEAERDRALREKERAEAAVRHLRGIATSAFAASPDVSPPRSVSPRKHARPAADDGEREREREPPRPPEPPVASSWAPPVPLDWSESAAQASPSRVHFAAPPLAVAHFAAPPTAAAPSAPAASSSSAAALFVRDTVAALRREEAARAAHATPQPAAPYPAPFAGGSLPVPAAIAPQPKPVSIFAPAEPRVTLRGSGTYVSTRITAPAPAAAAAVAAAAPPGTVVGGKTQGFVPIANRHGACTAAGRSDGPGVCVGCGRAGCQQLEAPQPRPKKGGKKAESDDENLRLGERTRRKTPSENGTEREQALRREIGALRSRAAGVEGAMLVDVAASSLRPVHAISGAPRVLSNRIEDLNERLQKLIASPATTSSTAPEEIWGVPCYPGK